MRSTGIDVPSRSLVALARTTQAAIDGCSDAMRLRLAQQNSILCIDRPLTSRRHRGKADSFRMRRLCRLGEPTHICR
jgi:hypothetical protein